MKSFAILLLIRQKVIIVIEIYLRTLNSFKVVNLNLNIIIIIVL